MLDLNAIQPDFIEWLEADGLVLPKDSAEQPATRPNVDSDSDSDNQDRMSATQGDEDEEEDDEEGAAAPSFPALDARIRQVIRDYDGAVFPKLNWSAPQVSNERRREKQGWQPLPQSARRSCTWNRWRNHSEPGLNDGRSRL